MIENDLDLRICRGGRPTQEFTLRPTRKFRDAVACEQVHCEVAMPLRNHLLQLGFKLLRVHLVHSFVLGRNNDVDAIGAVANMLVEPLEFSFELFGGKPNCAEDAEPTSI